MSSLPPLRRLSLDDFADQAKWISKLLNPLNIFFEQVVTTLNKGLTITDNFSGTIQTFAYSGTLPITLAWNLKSKPISVFVVNVARTDGALYTQPDAVQVQWEYNSAGQLQIDSVLGVVPKAKKCPSADVTTGTNSLLIPQHEFLQGMKVLATSTGTLPSGLTTGNSYYVIRTDANNIKLASTAANAAAGTAVSLGTQGSGYHILAPQVSTSYNITIECKTG